MNRISMVGSPALAEDRIPVSGPVAAVPESGTAVGGLGECTGPVVVAAGTMGSGPVNVLVGLVGDSQRAFISRRESASDPSAVPMLFVPTAPAAHE